MAYVQILGALLSASGSIFDKIIVTKKEMNEKKYIVLGFLGISVVCLPLLPFFFRMDPQAFQPLSLLIFALVLLFSLGSNWFTLVSLRGEQMGKLVSAGAVQPLIVILLAMGLSLVSPLFEGSPKVIIPAIIAACALLWSHMEKHHLSFNKYYLAALAGSFFAAIELVLSRFIIEYYSPLTFYFVRCTAIFLMGLALFRGDYKMSKQTLGWVLCVSAIWVLYRVIVYFGYVEVGVVMTTLLIMLGPTFLFLFSYLFLHERPKPKNLIASAVVVLSVIFTLFL